MKPGFLAIASIVCLTGCSKPEAPLKDRILGRWQIDMATLQAPALEPYKANKAQYAMFMQNFKTTEMSIQSDGTYAMQSAVSPEQLFGKWTFEKGILTIKPDKIQPGQPIPDFNLDPSGDRIHMTTPGFSFDFVKKKLPQE